jgi:hypothetical protein
MTDDINERIRDAIDADPGDKIVIKTPTFERQDGREPAEPPLTESAWEEIRNLSEEELVELGLQNWDGDLYLLPAEWYPHIPEGVELTTILGEQIEFEPGETNNDRRFGCLSYGFVVGMDDGEYRKEHERKLDQSIEEVVGDEVGQ